MLQTAKERERKESCFHTFDCVSFRFLYAIAMQTYHHSNECDGGDPEALHVAPMYSIFAQDLFTIVIKNPFRVQYTIKATEKRSRKISNVPFSSTSTYQPTNHHPEHTLSLSLSFDSGIFHVLRYQNFNTIQLMLSCVSESEYPTKT